MKHQDTERRKHMRYTANEDALIFCPKRYGKVIDISEGGMAVSMIDDPEPLPDEWETTFFCLDTNSKIDGLIVRVVRKEAHKTSRFSLTTQTIGVEFVNPTFLQQQQITQVISDQ